jgi:hypothetical protein
MDEILKQIEQDFLPQIQEAQEAFSVAELNLANLQATKEEKMKAVRDYYKAISDKEMAEIVIANTPQEIKAMK